MCLCGAGVVWGDGVLGDGVWGCMFGASKGGSVVGLAWMLGVEMSRSGKAGGILYKLAAQ
eukprot:364312-Chlamydomonas_euryale.AAC.1